jgi:hypothetical protein
MAPLAPDESDPQAISPPALEPELQRSWYYYLSEIASRRIANRIFNGFYKTGPQSWFSVPMARMQRIAEELDAQLVQWSEHIPHPVAFEDQPSSDELTSMLQGRFLELRERVWRPFLYLVIHEPPPPPSGPG